MDFLKNEGKKRRVLRSKGGNEVLRLSYPLVAGDTPAALHVAALIEALVDYAAREALKIAAEALVAAVKSGRLFDFTCHTYDVSLDLKHHEGYVKITLGVEFGDGKASIFSGKAVQYWDGDEQLQLPKAPRARQNAPQ